MVAVPPGHIGRYGRDGRMVAIPPGKVGHEDPEGRIVPR
jgi:hypothetical protein